MYTYGYYMICYYISLSETGFSYVAQAGPKLKALLLPRSWDYRRIRTHSASQSFFLPIPAGGRLSLRVLK